MTDEQGEKIISYLKDIKRILDIIGVVIVLWILFN